MNLHTKKDAYSLHRIDDALGSLSGNSYFSALDAASGYWQVPMASEEDREKAAFRTFCGHYQPTRMAFGLVNGPAQFQRMMDTALQGLNFRGTQTNRFNKTSRLGVAYYKKERKKERKKEARFSSSIEF